MRSSRPASSPRPSTTTEPRTKPLVVRRSTSVTLPVRSGKPPVTATSAAIGSPTAPASASPISIASVHVPRTAAPSRACATVMTYSVAAPAPPNSTAAERSSRSIHWPEIALKTSTLPRSSVITPGFGSIPARCMVTWGISGKARPMPSASTTGSPIRPAQVSGSRPFDPPISAGISAATVRPVIRSRCARRIAPSPPFSIFSMCTVGAPTIPHGRMSASAGSSSRRRFMVERYLRDGVGAYTHTASIGLWFSWALTGLPGRLGCVELGRLGRGDQLVEQVSGHEIRLSLERVTVAAARAGHQPDHVAPAQPQPRDLAEARPDRLAVAQHLDVIGRAVPAAGGAPGRVQVPAPGDGEQRLVAADPVLAHQAATATPAARAGSGDDVEAEALDQHAITLLGDLDRDRVGLAVADGDQPVLPVGVAGRAPAARLRLDEQGLLAGVLVRQRERRRAHRDERAGREAIGEGRRERVPHQVRGHLGGLEVGGEWSRAGGVEDGAWRADGRQRPEPAVGRWFCRVGDRLEDGADAGDQARPGAVDRTGHLGVAAGEVTGHAALGDLDA